MIDGEKKQKKVVDHILRANTFLSRLKGLMGTKSLSQGTGLLLEPCDNVHTWHMKYPIDVIYLDRNDLVLHIQDGMKPDQWGKRVPGARKVLEVNEGVAAAMDIKPGDCIDLETGGADDDEKK